MSEQRFRILKKSDGRFYAEVEKRSWFGTRWHPALEVGYTMEGMFNKPFDSEKECRKAINKAYLTPDIVVWEGSKP